MLDDTIYFKSYEIIGGEKFMSPSPILGHSNIITELLTVINNYLRRNNRGRVFADNTDVHFPDGSLFKPDLVVVTKENYSILNWKGAIYGVPDMVVEVLSPSTRVRDLTVKKDAYESNGVKEYWIVDPYMKTVDVYVLYDGKYKLENSYAKYSDYDFENLTDEEKAAVKYEIKVSIFGDLYVKVDDIFSWSYDS
ncbi:MAG: Uma2 family endonuclease [Selenomonadaceae bacterium]|nr:Uma2 family endonuclease [Selenomonadaceae bacterium]